jgi:hypothetical protein
LLLDALLLLLAIVGLVIPLDGSDVVDCNLVAVIVVEEGTTC